MVAPSTTSASKSPPATPSTPKSPGSLTKACSPKKRSTPPAASPPKTKSGSPAPAANAGRSTPSWPTPTLSDPTRTKPAARHDPKVCWLRFRSERPLARLVAGDHARFVSFGAGGGFDSLEPADRRVNLPVDPVVRADGDGEDPVFVDGVGVLSP